MLDSVGQTCREPYLLLLLAHTVQNFSLNPPSAAAGACTAGAELLSELSPFVASILSVEGGGGGGGGGFC